MKNETGKKSNRSFWNIINWLFCKKSDEQYARDVARKHERGHKSGYNVKQHIEKEVNISRFKSNIRR